MQEKENILRIFKEVKNAISQENSSKIKDLSNQTTNTASLTHDPENIAVAVIIYSLSKIIERKEYRKIGGWEVLYGILIKYVDNIIKSLEEKNDLVFKKNIHEMREKIENISGDMKQHIGEIFRKASINKASKIYEHGNSMEKTANLLGVTLFELANYSGERQNLDFLKNKKTEIKSRIDLAMDFFK